MKVNVTTQYLLYLKERHMNWKPVAIVGLAAGLLWGGVHPATASMAAPMYEHSAIVDGVFADCPNMLITVTADRTVLTPIDFEVLAFRSGEWPRAGEPLFGAFVADGSRPILNEGTHHEFRASVAFNSKNRALAHAYFIRHCPHSR